ncbi:MAG: serine/threonine protein kinase [Myxococcales bacterium]|nr:serine/threonine protein kinase [Myxococcales bacterium]
MSPLEPIIPNEMRPPRLGGRYVVVRLLGKGAQARAYLAWDLRLKQWRAIKVLGADFIDDPHLKARFETEAHTMARLSHPNLMRVLDVDRDGAIPYIVMELARGGSIVQWMKRNGPMPPRMAVEVAVQCADGLQYAHEQGVVHRDVKPHNILVHENGRVVITDFGIARVNDTDLTATGSAMGTFAFMAPEQRTDAKNVDPRADIYALGASFFTMLTQRTSSELFFAEARDELLDGVPDVLQPIILTACKYEREQRYRAMGDLREALQRRGAKLPPDEESPPLVEEVVLLPRESPPAVLEPEAHVEDIRSAISAQSEEAPTFVVGTRTATGLTNPPNERSFEEPASALPYVMPDRMSALRRAAKTGRTPPPKEPTPRPDDVPSYVDARAVTPAPAAHQPLLISPPEAEPEPDRTVARVATGIAAGAIGLILSILLFGLVQKSTASSALHASEEALVEETLRQAGVVEALEEAGADGVALRASYFAFEDAEGGRRVESAVAFVALVRDETKRVGASGIVETQANQLQDVLADYNVAQTKFAKAKASRAARLTGDVGFW